MHQSTAAAVLCHFVLARWLRFQLLNFEPKTPLNLWTYRVLLEDAHADTDAVLACGVPVVLLHTTITDQRGVQGGEIVTCTVTAPAQQTAAAQHQQDPSRYGRQKTEQRGGRWRYHLHASSITRSAQTPGQSGKATLPLNPGFAAGELRPPQLMPVQLHPRPAHLCTQWAHGGWSRSCTRRAAARWWGCRQCSSEWR